ncbi:MAG: hypothetical protein JSU63_01560 [Phycisphaerales bacterium]|nr:MAG: hypothetical protein JSU63_01560 [Phycisphaerales bacterium]
MASRPAGCEKQNSADHSTGVGQGYNGPYRGAIAGGLRQVRLERQLVFEAMFHSGSEAARYLNAAHAAADDISESGFVDRSLVEPV